MANESLLQAGFWERSDQRPHLLIVDDERGPRESLRMILSGSYDITTAENGTDALDLIRTTAIDLVTLDLNMPGMKGDELMRTIRAEFPQTEIIIITGCSSIETAVEGIRHGVFDYLTKPFDVVQVTASVQRAIERRQGRSRMSGLLDELGRILESEGEADRLHAHLETTQLAPGALRALIEPETKGSRRKRGELDAPRTIEFLEVLAETIESHDLFMRGHARRVAFYADVLAGALCLSLDERKQIRIAAFLHDIGKVGTPRGVLAGDVIPDPERGKAVHSHPTIGERLLLPLDLDASISTIVRHHHERFDGAGYPDGIAGEDIPLAARIICITDAFDAMSCERPYRPARTREEALEELIRESGKQFDPNLVRIFHKQVLSGASDAVAEANTLRDSETRETTRLRDQGAA